MTSKEALERLFGSYVSSKLYGINYKQDDEDYNIIKQDLDRLEKLKKKNVKLKQQNKKLKDKIYNYKLCANIVEPFNELNKEKLKQLEKENASLHTKIESLRSENEILKKAIENSNKAYDVLMQNSNIQFLNQNQEIEKLKKLLRF